jgi:hypothetical protein
VIALLRIAEDPLLGVFAWRTGMTTPARQAGLTCGSHRLSPCTPIIRPARCIDLCAIAHTASACAPGTPNVCLRHLYKFQSDLAVSVDSRIV